MKFFIIIASEFYEIIKKQVLEIKKLLSKLDIVDFY